MNLAKIMFIRQTEPMVDLEVRSPTLDPTHTLKTDAEGRVCLAIEPGLHTLEIFDQGRWVTHSFQRRQDNDLIVVQLAPVLASKTTHNQLKQQLQGLGDRYRIERVLGRGGMGIVIKAHDHVLERPVAIKMLNEQWQDNATAQKLFFDEARQLAGLKHPNLVAVHDVTTLEGIVVMIMEFVQGHPLDAILNEQGPLAPPMLHQVAGQLGAAMCYLHRQGVIHRDIKPGNMLWREDNTLKIIDFGLARSLKQLNIRGTQVRGTPAYMAPEQLLGQPLTFATDLYQAGVSLFELASGRLPFDEESIATDHIQTLAPSIKSFVPSIDQRLAECIDRSLQKDPLQRPDSASCFAQLIAAPETESRITSPEVVLSSPPVIAAPSTTQPQATPAKPSRRWPLVVAVFFMISLSGLAAFALWSAQHTAELPTTPQPPQLLAKATPPPVHAPPKLEPPKLAAPDPSPPPNLAHDAAREQSSSVIHASTEQALELADDAATPSPERRKARRARRVRKAQPEPTPEPIATPEPEPEPAPQPEPEPAPVEVKLLTPPKVVAAPKPEPAKEPAPEPPKAKPEPEPPPKKTSPIPRSF